MRTVQTWATQMADADGVPNPINCIVYRPDGQQLMAAAGASIHVYNASDGEVITVLNPHTDTVYTMAWSKDGKRMASGGADKTVIIWTRALSGILKYSHNDSIQCVQYNPVTQQLASCTASDFGLWSPEQKNVQKYKIGKAGRILCCAWTNDGRYLALGHFGGVVSIRSRQTDWKEKVVIQRSAPVWTLAWSPSRTEKDLLTVGDWDGKMSFYQLSGKQVGKDRNLGYDPCTVQYFSNGQYIVAGGSDRKLSLWTKEGVRLTDIVQRDSWVWSSAVRPRHNYVAVGTYDGLLSVNQLMFSTVHGLYQETYAFREAMTNVVIQLLMKEQRVVIPCHDYIKKIAIYKTRLAVQLPSRIIIYDLFYDSDGNLSYEEREKIQRKLDCNLLVVTSNHIILCLEKRLQLLSFKGEPEREWVLDSLIRYIKVIGGPEGCEGLLAGLKDGTVLKVFINNAFPVPIIQHDAAIRCLDLSVRRTKLALVDEHSKCIVYDMATKRKLYSEDNANSVAWNTEMDDMLAFSGANNLHIKAGNFPVTVSPLKGFVVGFKGSKIFCLHVYAMQTIHVPQSGSLQRYLGTKDFANAYHIACLGVTTKDWQQLAFAALQAMELTVARKAFIRLRDMRYIDLLNRVEDERRRGLRDDKEFLADVYAIQHRYHDAAKVYLAAGKHDKAVRMYMDLCMWDEAAAIARNAAPGTVSVDVNELLRRQAAWLEESDSAAAAELYLQSGDVNKAIALHTASGNMDGLVGIVRTINKTETTLLRQCADVFKQHNRPEYAAEVFDKINATEELLELYVEQQLWDRAFALAEDLPDLAARLYMPYAHHLALQDQYDEAQKAFVKAGHPEEALRVLEQLTHNAVVEERYRDAGYFYFLLAQNHADQVRAGDLSHVDAWRHHVNLSEVYLAFDSVHRFSKDPFTSLESEAVFNTARYLLMHTLPRYGGVPYNVSILATLYAFARVAEQLECYKLARYVYQRALTMRCPSDWLERISLAAVLVRAKPYCDKEDLAPLCARCTAPNPVLNAAATRDSSVDVDACTVCGAAMAYSFYTFDTLPLVEFHLAPGITEAEAAKLLAQQPSSTGAGGARSGWKESKQQGDVQTLSFDAGDGAVGTGTAAPGTADPLQVFIDASRPGARGPIVVDRAALAELQSNHVFVQDLPCGARYWRNVLPESTPVVLCSECQHFFHADDYDQAVLETGGCPLCRHTPGKIMASSAASPAVYAPPPSTAA